MRPVKSWLVPVIGTRSGGRLNLEVHGRIFTGLALGGAFAQQNAVIRRRLALRSGLVEQLAAGKMDLEFYERNHVPQKPDRAPCPVDGFR